MYFIYSIVYTLGFLLMLPAFLLNRQKYASGFRQRLGNHPEFKHDDRKVIWLHCVSVGETNAARPLVDKLIEEFPHHRLIVSTITKTGQELAQKIFADKADAIFYLPFDWKFTVRRALSHFKPSLVLLMETEIWPRFIHEAKQSGAKVAIVNGRLSERSATRYSKVKGFISRVMFDVDLGLMQTPNDAKRLVGLGIDRERVQITGNMKFDQVPESVDSELTEYFRDRFGISKDKPLMLAASTHEPEERYVLESLDGVLPNHCRLMIAPRHPERFDAVAKALENSSLKFVRRTAEKSEGDKTAEIILLDSIGELRSVYPLAEIVFVGGSLVPRGGQSILEPALEGKAIVTGPYTHNFESVVKTFLEHDAILQTPKVSYGFDISKRLGDELCELFYDESRRDELGRNAKSLMERAGGDATDRTVKELAQLIG
jgi:3-deoxy-D-manno-octulosonic-acid transferase